LLDHVDDELLGWTRASVRDRKTPVARAGVPVPDPGVLITGFTPRVRIRSSVRRGPVGVGSCRRPAWGQALPNATGAVAALGVADACCNARRTWQVPDEVLLAEDRHLVGEFGADGQYEVFGEAARPRTARRNFDHLNAGIGQHGVERGRELPTWAVRGWPHWPRTSTVYTVATASRRRSTCLCQDPLFARLLFRARVCTCRFRLR